jgi:hypothetical protein
MCVVAAQGHCDAAEKLVDILVRVPHGKEAHDDLPETSCFNKESQES